MYGQDWPQISLSPAAAGLQFPVHIAHAGDGSNRLFVVELTGKIRIVKNGVVLGTPFLDLGSRAGCSQGLLSVAFPPGYASKRHFYVNYTDASTCNLVISRFSLSAADPDRADDSSEQIILSIPKPPEYAGPAIFHSGGELAFGPDGYLYVGIGDGHTGASPGDVLNLAQDVSSLRGKILRMDVETGNPSTYIIPATNPYSTTGGTTRPEIWAVGVRNPWRSSFDRQTGDFYIADVGQDSYEEINFQPAGSAGGLNYGWHIMEGDQCYNSSTCNQTGLTLPIAGYVNARNVSDCSITGGHVYRGTLYPRMNGVYFYGDYCSGKIWGLRNQNGAWQTTLLRDPAVTGAPVTSEGLVSFGEDEAGNVYLTDRVTGTIYQITDSVTNTAPTASPQSVVINEDTPTNITLSASDADGNALTYYDCGGERCANRE